MTKVRFSFFLTVTLLLTALPFSPTFEGSSLSALTAERPAGQGWSSVRYVATDGSDADGDGTVDSPWATISHAVTQVADGATILVRPGWYEQQVVLTGSFTQGITIRSEVPYQAQLRYNREQVVTCFDAQGIALEGFDIAHLGPGAGIYVVQIQDELGAEHWRRALSTALSCATIFCTTVITTTL
ncbi:MAG: hypothetical protein R2932_50600 [Caldilineaceae bacterium]